MTKLTQAAMAPDGQMTKTDQLIRALQYTSRELRSQYLNIKPYLRTRRTPRNAITDTMTFTIHNCYCRMKDDGEKLIECSKCNEWYDHSCVKKRLKKKEIWYCNYYKVDIDSFITHCTCMFHLSLYYKKSMITSYYTL